MTVITPAARTEHHPRPGGVARPTPVDLAIEPVAGALGAIVHDIDLAGPLDDATIAAIRHALLTHRVLAFRGQTLDHEGQQRFATRFGPLTTAHPTVPSLRNEPRVFDIDSSGGQRTNVWHADVTFVDRPPLASVLRAVTVPPHGGDTVFANTVAALAALPGPLRALVESLDVIHTNAFDYARALATVSTEEAEGVVSYGKVFSSTSFETRHPLVQVHPETGERALLAGGFARRIAGLPSRDGNAILKLVHDHVTVLENTVRWRWAPGDVVFWDNRTTQHYALADYGNAPRRLQRVTIAGTVPVGIDGRRSQVIEGDSSAYSPRSALPEGRPRPARP